MGLFSGETNVGEFNRDIIDRDYVEKEDQDVVIIKKGKNERRNREKAQNSQRGDRETGEFCQK